MENQEFYINEFNNLLEVVHIVDEEKRYTKLFPYFSNAISKRDIRFRLLIVFSKEFFIKLLKSNKLSQQKRLAIFAKVCSWVLMHKDNIDHSKYLQDIVNYNTDFAQECVLVISSYLKIFHISKPITVVTVVSIHSGQISLLHPTEHQEGENSFAIKMNQFEDLYGINENIKWKVVFIDDGDDRKLGNVYRSKRTAEIIRKLLKERYEEEYLANKFIIVEMDQDVRNSIGSYHGGAILYGMHKALQEAADYILYTNLDLDTHIGLQGSLLGPLVNNNIDVAVGSNRFKGSFISVPFSYYLHSVILNWYVRKLLPVGKVLDTHNAFKGFTSKALKSILPITNNGSFDLDVDYTFSTPDMLLSRANVMNYKIEEVPVAMHRTAPLNMKLAVKLAIRFYIKIWQQKSQLRSWMNNNFGPRSLLNTEEETIEAPSYLKLKAISIDENRMLKLASLLRKSDKKIKIAIIVPMYEENIRIKKKPSGENFLRVKMNQLIKMFSGLEDIIEWEIILVDDGCPKKSGEAAEKILKEEYADRYSLGQARVLSISVTLSKKIGSKKGGAVALGMEEAIKEYEGHRASDIAILIDADLSVDLTQIDKLLYEILNNHNSIVIGSRAKQNGAIVRGRSLRARISSKAYNWAVSILLPKLSYIRDTQCGFKAFTKEALLDILPLVKDNGFSFDTEWLLMLNSFKYKIIEKGIVWNESLLGSTLTIKDSLNCLRALYRQRQRQKVMMHSLIGLNRFMDGVEIAERFGEQVSLSGAIRNFVELCQNLKGRFLDWNQSSMIRKALSVLLTRTDATFVADRLMIFIGNEEFGQATLFIKSFLVLFHINQKMKVTTVISIFSPEAEPVDTETPEFLSARIEQQEDLYRVNRLLTWKLILVYEPHRCKHDDRLLLKFLRIRYPNYYESNKIEIIRLPTVNVYYKKGAGVVYGMHKAIEDKTDYVIFADFKPAIDLSLEGLLLSPVLEKRNVVSIGSRYIEANRVKRSFHRQIISKAYNTLLAKLWSHLAHIYDTQCPLKCFSTDVLRQILPINNEGEFDSRFDYGLAFDTDLISKILLGIKGAEVKEIQISFYWPFIESLRFFEIVRFFIGILGQRRKFLKMNAKYINQANDSLEMEVITNEKVDVRSIEKALSIKKRNNRVNIVLNAGQASRQGLLSISSGSKGDIRILGMKLKELARKSLMSFSRNLPEGNWCSWIATDSIVWMHKDDWPNYKNTIMPENRIVVLGFRNQENIENPPFSSIWAARKESLNSIVSSLETLWKALGKTPKEIDNIYHSILWTEFARPTVLSLKQWQQASGYHDVSEEQWSMIWKHAQNSAKVFNPKVVTVDAPISNINSPKQIYALYQSLIKRDTLEQLAFGQRIRSMFGLHHHKPIQVTGAVEAEGDYYVRNSVINIEKGKRLLLGDKVIIDDSILMIDGGNDLIVKIPSGTVISNSRIHGQFSGDGENGLIYSVRNFNGITFVKNSVQTTVYLMSGRILHGMMAMDYDIEAKLNLPIDSLEGFSIRDLISMKVDVKRNNRISKKLLKDINSILTNEPENKRIKTKPHIEIINENIQRDIRLLAIDWHRSIVIGVNYWVKIIEEILIDIIYGENAKQHQINKIRNFINTNASKLGSPGLFEWAFQKVMNKGLQLEKEKEEYIDQYVMKMKKARHAFITSNPGVGILYNGISEFLKVVRTLEMIAVVLTGAYTREKETEIIEHGFNDYITETLGRDIDEKGGTDNFKKRKLKQLILKYHLLPNQIAMISDNPEDILIIKALKGVAIGFAYNFTIREKLIRMGADIIINGEYPTDINEIHQILKGKTSKIVSLKERTKTCDSVKDYIVRSIVCVDQNAMIRGTHLSSRLLDAFQNTFEGIKTNVLANKMNPFVKLDGRLLLSYDHREDRLVDSERMLNIGYFGIGGNPLHWGHILVSLISMRILALDSIIFRVHGEIQYKTLNAVDYIPVDVRQRLYKNVIDNLFPLIRYSDTGHVPKNQNEAFEEMLLFLLRNRKRRINMIFLVGNESEERFIRYTKQFYLMMKRYQSQISKKHYITIGWVQRKKYGALMTYEELNRLNTEIVRSMKIKKKLNMILIKDKDIDQNISSSKYRRELDPNLVPYQVDVNVRKNGYYGYWDKNHRREHPGDVLNLLTSNQPN